jgi:DNA-binding NarL/FixJ family response regulator
VADDDRAATLRRAVAHLEARAGDRALVLVVDDAHLLDEATAALLPLLVTSEHVLPVVTIRAGEPFGDAVAALIEDTVGEQVDLPPLDDETVRAVLEHALGGPVDDPTAERFTQASRGNALFLRELVDAAVGAGTLREHAGTWRLEGRLVTTERLLELVRDRVGVLDDVERAALELVAIGEPVGIVLLERIVGPDVTAALERSHVLEVEQDGRRVHARLAHPLFGEVVRADLPGLRAIQLRRALASATAEAGARRRVDALRISTWQLDAGEPSDPAMLLAAARHARAAADFELALRLIDERGTEIDARLLHAELLALVGRSEDAVAVLTEAATVAGGDRERGAVAATLADIAVHGARWPDAVLDVLDDAVAAIDDPEWLAQLAARRAVVHLMIDGPATAATFEPPAGPSAATVVGGITAGWSAAVDLRPDDAERIASIAAAAHRRPRTEPLLWHRSVHDVYRCHAWLLAGRLDDARAGAMAAYERAVADGQPTLRAWFAWLLGRVELLAGDIDRSRAHADEALGLSRRMGRLFAERWAASTALEGAALAGDVDGAAALLARLDAIGAPDTGILAADGIRARAWAAASTGELSRAADLLADAASVARASRETAAEAFALVDLVRLRHPGDAAHRLAQLAAARPTPLVEAFAGFAAGVVARDGRSLAAAAAALDALGARLLAAEAYGAAAEAFVADGQPRQASGPERRSADLLAACPGARPPTIGGTSAVGRLTAREREVATLAAAGRSNKQIAEQLSLSVRTVENQLCRVYEKLDLTGREELVRALAR